MVTRLRFPIALALLLSAGVFLPPVPSRDSFVPSFLRPVNVFAQAQDCGVNVMAVGIPCPPFGLEESSAIYDGEQFVAGGFPYRSDSPGNGPYSHYTDNSDKNCTDTANTYGTVTTPRCTPQTTLPAGSVQLIKGGPYAPGATLTFAVSGTAALPVFIIGILTAGAKPIIDQTGTGDEVVLSGSYAILDSVELTDSRIYLGQTGDGSDHLTLRNSEVSGGGPGHLLGTEEGQQIVFWRNEAHDGVAAGEVHNVNVYAGSKDVWILENDLHHPKGDAIQYCHGCRTEANSASGPENVYMGKNTMQGGLGGSENCWDQKGGKGVAVFSENLCDGSTLKFTGGQQQGVRINDEGFLQAQTWILNNRFRGLNQGVDSTGASAGETGGAGIFIYGNTFLNILQCETGGTGQCTQDAGVAINAGFTRAANNAIYNVLVGITGAYQTQVETEVSNNIVESAATAHIQGIDAATSCVNNHVYQGGSATTVDADCTSTLTSDPQMTNPAGGDFSIPTTSPAKDSGLESAGYATFSTTYAFSIAYDQAVTARPQGGTWDRGAYEFSSSGSQTSAYHGKGKAKIRGKDF